MRMQQFYEHADRCILVIDAGAGGGWAWSNTNQEWLSVTPEFAGRVWAQGHKLTEDDAKRQFCIRLDQLPLV